jgi:hypothetical protein
MLPEPIKPLDLLLEEHDLPFITTDMLQVDLVKAAERMKEMGEPWLAEICRIARDHIHGLETEKRWLRVKTDWNT